MLADPKISEDVKTKLKIVLEVREFAEQQLGLKVGSNYLDYVPLQEDAVTFVVNAAEKYELKTYYWSYPIVGKLPYRGYPSKTDAEKEASSMKNKGYDVFVRGVSAYSTLGWFDDPVFSSMINMPVERLVETIIHESVHATVFYKDDADFNERLATFLGIEGAKLFYQFKKQPQMVEKIETDKKSQIKFAEFMNQEFETLKAWYINVLKQVEDPLQKDKQKQLRLDEISDRLLKAGVVKEKPVGLNNARLMLFSTYRGNTDDFTKLYSSHKSFKDLIAYLKTVKHSKDILAK